MIPKVGKIISKAVKVIAKLVKSIFKILAAATGRLAALNTPVEKVEAVTEDAETFVTVYTEKVAWTFRPVNAPNHAC